MRILVLSALVVALVACQNDPKKEESAATNEIGTTAEAPNAANTVES